MAEIPQGSLLGVTGVTVNNSAGAACRSLFISALCLFFGGGYFLILHSLNYMLCVFYIYVYTHRLEPIPEFSGKEAGIHSRLVGNPSQGPHTTHAHIHTYVCIHCVVKVKLPVIHKTASLAMIIFSQH